MTWIFEGIIVNIIWVIIGVLTKASLKFVKKHISKLKFNSNKVRFNLLLLILVLYTANTFLNFRFFFEYGFGYLITVILAFTYLYFSVIEEYNNLFKQLFKK